MKDGKPRVTVIISAYNGEKYIAETISSCLSQSLEDLELIVIDDASSDGTAALVAGFEDTRMRFFRNEENMGIARNINAGVSMAAGEYILLLGHDDVLPETHLEKMLAAFDTETVLLHCNAVVINGDGKEIRLAREDVSQFKKDADPARYLARENFIQSCGMVFRKETFLNVGGWDETYRLYGEWLMYARFLAEGKIRYTDTSRARYRRHNRNISGRISASMPRDYIAYRKRCRRLAASYTRLRLSDYLAVFLDDLSLNVKRVIRTALARLRGLVRFG
jgi:glycosyltransferase involved in cell wall biosynthesis